MGKHRKIRVSPISLQIQNVHYPLPREGDSKDFFSPVSGQIPILIHGKRELIESAGLGGHCRKGSASRKKSMKWVSGWIFTVKNPGLYPTGKALLRMKLK